MPQAGPGVGMGDDKRPRLLILTSTFPRWVDDHEPPFVFELARRLAADFAVTVSAPHAPGALDQERMDGVSVYRFRYAPQRFEHLAYDGGIPTKLRRRPWLFLLVPLFLLAQMHAAYRLMRRVRPDVVHAHWLIPSGLIGALLQAFPGHPPFRLVVTAHGADVHLGDRWPSGWLKRMVLASADVVTVVSRALRDRLAARIPAGTVVEVAPMGVDLQTLFVPSPQPAEEPVLVFAGRLVAKKGVADLLTAMPAIIDQVPRARLLIVGDGPLAADLRALSTQLALGDAVEFLGSVPNRSLPDILRRARLAVFPFRIADDGDQEGLGLVSVEAMGCGIPVLAADIPAIHDVVLHDRNGWLVPSADPPALADAVCLLLREPDRRARLADQARADALRGFDWSVVAARYRQILGSDTGQ